MSSSAQDGSFFKLFPGVDADSELYELFNDVRVLNVSVYKKSRKLDIHIASSKHIPVSAITKVENYLSSVYGLDKKILNDTFSVKVRVDFAGHAADELRVASGVVDTISGKPFSDSTIPIIEVTPESGRVAVRGDIINVEFREIRGERFICSFDLTDYKSCVTVKMFVNKYDVDLRKEQIKTGISVKVRGEAQFDKYAKKLTIMARDILELNKQAGMDTAEALKPSGQVIIDGVIAFDIETTGLDAAKDRITEIGAVRIVNGQVKERFNTFVNPGIPIPENIVKLTGITDDMVADAPSIDEALADFLEFIGKLPVVAHNAGFDTGFIRFNAGQCGRCFDNTVVDTLQMSRVMLKGLGRYKLNIVASHLGVRLENHHRASDDAEAAGMIFVKCLEKLNDKVIKTVDDLQKFLKSAG